MTTLKPQLVRADTLDLQALDAPSAKDHTRQPTHPAPYGLGPAAPHQNQSLRNAEYESYNEQRKYSPRVPEDPDPNAYPEEPSFYEEPDERSEHDRIVQGGGQHGATADGNEYEDGDQMEDDMDDDMMDKISSSPSISDGKYTLPVWPERSSSIGCRGSRSPLPLSTRDAQGSSSPSTCPPETFPFFSSEVKGSASRHHLGECRPYSRAIVTGRSVSDRATSATQSQHPSQTTSIMGSKFKTHDHRCNSTNYGLYLLPDHDPLVDAEGDGRKVSDDEEADWEDEDSDFELYSDDDDDAADFHFSDDPRFLDSGWGGECLREIEDIDFEFVYALHTFVATVEGQANATKGDTMVLLDDSNSYWWLVRVVKDSSIGYLPAEHIETPTERLARLNKHRNIDLSQAMLGDNPERSRNPLKKAIRRRTAKTVQFAPPTYYEPSDYGYSDEDEDEDSQLPNGDGTEQSDDGEPQQATLEAVSASASVEATLQPNATVSNGVRRVTSDDSLRSQESSPVKSHASGLAAGAAAEVGAVAVAERNGDAASRSRKGVVRNTDSFFKDDSVETKKISLTPRLLRGDSDANITTTEQETRHKPSLENFDKLIGSEDKTKDDKKRKEKKGMLSGFFKRKDKTPKGIRADGDDNEKVSEDSTGLSTGSKESFDSLTKTEQAPERKLSKLQKQPPMGITKALPVEDRQPQRDDPSATYSTTAIPQPTSLAPSPPFSQSMQTNQWQTQPDKDLTSPSSNPPQARSSMADKRSIFAPITTVLKSSPSNSSLEQQETTGKPIHSKRAKQRFAIDDSDSEDESTPTTGQHRTMFSAEAAADPQPRSHAPIQNPTIDQVQQRATVDSAPQIANLNNVRVDEPSAVGLPDTEAVPTADSDESISTTKASPSLEATTPSTSRSTPTWSDASLRSYMDNDQGIKDLLIIVHDNSNVNPVGPDHPLMGNLFVNERTRLAEMQSNLDSMLTSWMARKNATLLSS